MVEVDPEGAAHAAGIRKGDVIIGIQELSIDNSSKLLEEIAKHRPNDKVTVKIKRGSDVKQMEVVLRNKSGNTGIVKSDVVAAIDALGGQFADISDRARKELKINGGVQVVAISGDGVLAQAASAPAISSPRSTTVGTQHNRPEPDYLEDRIDRRNLPRRPCDQLLDRRQITRFPAMLRGGGHPPRRRKTKQVNLQNNRDN